jgi:hypothetical protein
MNKTLLFTRKYNKETYSFYLNSPSYAGEVGILGIEITPYISCITPDNGFGYTDTVLLNTNISGDKVAYTLNRGLTPWILKKIEKII